MLSKTLRPLKNLCTKAHFCSKPATVMSTVGNLPRWTTYMKSQQLWGLVSVFRHIVLKEQNKLLEPEPIAITVQSPMLALIKPNEHEQTKKNLLISGAATVGCTFAWVFGLKGLASFGGLWSSLLTLSGLALCSMWVTIPLSSYFFLNASTRQQKLLAFGGLIGSVSLPLVLGLLASKTFLLGFLGCVGTSTLAVHFAPKSWFAIAPRFIGLFPVLGIPLSLLTSTSSLFSVPWLTCILGYELKQYQEKNYQDSLTCAFNIFLSSSLLLIDWIAIAGIL